MARSIHVFRSPDRFVAGTVGQPGDRTFYLQAVHDERVVSVILEKQQVAVLAERIAALLLEINRRFGTPVPPETTEVEDLSPLITPVDAEFRVGTMGLGWDSEAETVVVEIADFGRGRHEMPDVPDLDLKLAGLQSPRGWGLFLARSLVDDIEEFSDGDRHLVRLTMRVRAAEGVNR